MSDVVRLRESAEVQRGVGEAAQISDESLTLNPRNLQRYLAPPADSPHPYEYCYHLLGDIRGKRVLDYGSGSGENTVLLAKKGAHVTALDISQELMEVGRRRAAINRYDAHFVLGSCHQSGLPDESFDIVFGTAVLHHLDLSLASREVRRLLKPGGIAVFLEPTRDSATLRFVRKLIPYQHPDVSPFERPLTTKELESFSDGFIWETARHFSLPLLSTLGLHRTTNWMMRLPFMYHFAAGRAFRLRKPTER